MLRVSRPYQSRLLIESTEDLVPTVLRGNAVFDALRRLAVPRRGPTVRIALSPMRTQCESEDDAERRRRHSHAEHGNEEWAALRQCLIIPQFAASLAQSAQHQNSRVGLYRMRAQLRHFATLGSSRAPLPARAVLTISPFECDHPIERPASIVAAGALAHGMFATFERPRRASRILLATAGMSAYCDATSNSNASSVLWIGKF